MKKIYLFSLFLFGTLQLFSQQYKVEYIYDSAGNRTSRTVVTIPRKAQAKITDIEPLEQNLEKCKITIHPNPTKGMLNLEIAEGDEICNYSILVFSSNGQKLIESTQIGNGHVPLDLSSYQTGFYLLFLKYGDEEVQYKIIKN